MPSPCYGTVRSLLVCTLWHGLHRIHLHTPKYTGCRLFANYVEIKVRVLFFSISAKLKQIHESSEVKGFVRIDQTGNWTKWEFDANSFEQAMEEVKKLEEHMFNIPSIVNSMPCTKLFALRVVVTPNVGDAFKVAVFLELEKMLNELQVMSVASSKCRIDFEVDKIKRSLKDLKDYHGKIFLEKARGNKIK